MSTNCAISPSLLIPNVAQAHTANEQLLAGIVGSAMDAIITIDAQQRIVLFNQAAERMFCCPAAAALGQSVERFLPARLRPNHSRRIQVFARRPKNARAMGRPLAVRGLRTNGEEFPIEASIAKLTINDTPFFTVILRDVTERQQHEEALRSSEQRLQMALHAANMGVWEWNAATTSTYWSPECLAIFGVEALDDYQNVLNRLIHPDDRARIQREVTACIHQRLPYVVEFRAVHPHGEIRWLLSRGNPICDSDNRLLRVIGIIQDTTERVRLEEQLRQAQKMEAIGQLAGGVAHDFNNLLTVINGYSSLLLNKLPTEDRSRSALKHIQDAGERATALTRQLLAFSRKQILEPRVVDLNEILGEIESMLRRLIGEDIALITLLMAKNSRVKVDPHQIEQVVLNLAINARDAMPHGGKLTLETRNVVLDEAYCRLHSEVKPGFYIRLAMTDTGEGIPPAVRDRIFEPFFTTKVAGKGTGLGLATVFGIVKQSEGHIKVYSEVGVGTCFKVYLPVIGETKVDPAKSPAPLAAEGSETVLLVEDDEAVRKIARLALEEHGYQVLEAEDGAQALALVQEQADSIQLLLTDVVMPNLGGSSLVQHLHNQLPALKTLYMSGYTDDAVVRHSILHDECAFINKPFSPLALAQKVREVLDTQS
jgi:PAS domain S-box-containing protein